MTAKGIKSVKFLDSDVFDVLSSDKKSKKKKKKKQTGVLKPLEREIKLRAEKQKKAAASYIKRHNRSNEKKDDGWIRDFPKNYAKYIDKIGYMYGLPRIGKLF